MPAHNIVAVHAEVALRDLRQALPAREKLLSSFAGMQASVAERPGGPATTEGGGVAPPSKRRKIPAGGPGRGERPLELGGVGNGLLGM